jgi:hypothetical protein
MRLAIQIAVGIVLAVFALAFLALCIAMELDEDRTTERGCGCMLFIGGAVACWALWNFVLSTP